MGRQLPNSSLVTSGGGGGGPVSSIFRTPLGTPRVADLSIIEGIAGQTTLDDDPSGGIDIHLPRNIGGTQFLLKSLHAPPYDIVFGASQAVSAANLSGIGIALRESVSGKLWTWGRFNGVGFGGTTAMEWSDPATVARQYQTYGYPSNGIFWFRVKDDGFTRSWYASVGGLYWAADNTFVPAMQEASGTYLVPDQFGIYLNSAGCNFAQDFHVFELSVT